MGRNYTQRKVSGQLDKCKGVTSAIEKRRTYNSYSFTHSKYAFNLEQSGRFPPWRLYCEILSRLLVYTNTRKHKHTHVHLGDTLDNKNYIKPGTSLDNNNTNTTPFTFIMIITLQVQVYSGHWFESWYIYITYNKNKMLILIWYIYLLLIHKLSKEFFQIS